MGFARSFKRRMRTPGYVDRVAGMVKTGKIKPGVDQIVNIYHEDHCVWWTGSKRCNCHPEIKIGALEGPGEVP